MSHFIVYTVPCHRQSVEGLNLSILHGSTACYDSGVRNDLMAEMLHIQRLLDLKCAS